MKKMVSLPIGNAHCPQGIYLIGVYTKEGKANFSPRNWFSYCWHKGQMAVMLAVGVDADGSLSQTEKRIVETGELSATIVTEAMLSTCDKLGFLKGNKVDKSTLVSCFTGEKLNVPILEEAMLTYELKVLKTVQLDGSYVFICTVANVLADARLANEALSVDEKMAIVQPVVVDQSSYISVGQKLEPWGFTQ